MMEKSKSLITGLEREKSINRPLNQSSGLFETLMKAGSEIMKGFHKAWVNGDGFCKLSEVPAIVEAMNKAMDSLLTDKKTEIPFEQENAKEIDSAQRILLKARIEKAKGIYKDMVEQAKKGRCMGS